jgi:hypothetical protein
MAIFVAEHRFQVGREIRERRRQPILKAWTIGYRPR